ncbi:MAG: T9SS type A sorting domain-containing protein [Chitinophagaceae bacterium]|nr:T9SS type A sorting domain-containing protein [Chitinophagaceae bacterium]
MHIIAKENEGQEINFFVFDVEGTLVQNFKMKSKDHNRITGLARGTYLYRVFNGDEETAAGNFEIR